MAAVEYAEWARYFADDPFGEVRADLRAGVIASAVVNALRGRKGTAAKPLDFMPIIRQQQNNQQARIAAIRTTFEGNLGVAVKRTKLKMKRN